MKILIIGLMFVTLSGNAFAYYNPSTGRWLSRDPIGEEAFRHNNLPKKLSQKAEESNLYSFVKNDAINTTDLLGLISSFEDCNCCQIEALKKDESLAHSQISSLISKINDVLPTVMLKPDDYPWQAENKLKRAVNNLERATERLKDAKVKCNSTGGSIATTIPFGRTINIDPAYWNYSDQVQSASLIHEATHQLGTTDVRYFWQNSKNPSDTFLVPWQDIASTYDTWLINGFCIPGYDCNQNNNVQPVVPIARPKECP